MMFFEPIALSTISHINAAPVVSVSTQNQSSLSLNQDTVADRLETPSRLTPATTPNLIAQASNECGPGEPRDKYTWPFACNSIWNMPIGANAKYVDAYIGSRGVSVDTDYFITTSQSDPAVPTYAIGSWARRCNGTTPQQQAQWHREASEPLNVPYNLIIPDVSGHNTPNNSSAFLMPNGRTLVSFNATARCWEGGPLYGNWFGRQDIYGDGKYGGHGGSGLSSIGGSIRKGELLNDAPIRHALKIVIWHKWMHYNPSSSTPGRRWPAHSTDLYAAGMYQGSNPALVMGSLLAIPPNLTVQSLGLTSKAGKKIFQAMQDYGAYVVDDSYWDHNYLCVEHSAEQEYLKVTGRPIYADTEFQADFNKIIAAVKVIDNNGPNSIGGGGDRRVPYAPRIGN